MFESTDVVDSCEMDVKPDVKVASYGSIRVFHVWVLSPSCRVGFFAAFQLVWKYSAGGFSIGAECVFVWSAF